jgi:hypothetical protein
MWRRLTIEAFVIVGSILLAFAIDAAWDTRQAREELREVLEGLGTELEENRGLVAESSSRTILGVERLIRFSAGSTEELLAIPTSDTYDEFYLPLVVSYDVTISTGALRATISSGQLALIPDPDTRAALTGLEAAFSEIPRLTAEIDRMGAEAATVLGEYEGVQRMWATEPFTLDAETIRTIHGDTRLKGFASGKIIYLRGYLYVLNDTVEPRLDLAIALVERALQELR